MLAAATGVPGAFAAPPESPEGHEASTGFALVGRGFVTFTVAWITPRLVDHPYYQQWNTPPQRAGQPSHYWNDRHRAVGLRFEPFVGGRFIEVYDAPTGEGVEIARIQVWDPGHRLVYTWRESGWAPGDQTEVEVLFEPLAQGTRVTVTHRGWDRVTDGKKQSEGYVYGLRDLLAWYGEAAGTVSA